MESITALKWLTAKEVVGGEASHFTPWLADNLDLIAGALGLEDIRNVETEVSVMSKSVDIVATATDQDGREIEVVIENQYGETNHTHLGQLITYLAPHDCGYAVWVTEKCHPAHINAIDFLNRATSDSYDFFLLQVRFTHGKDGAHQVYFELVAKPNRFVEGQRRRSKGKSAAPVMEGQVAYLGKVLSIAKTPLEQLGFRSVGMHPRGSYIEMRLPLQSLNAWESRLKIYTPRNATHVRLLVNSSDAEANYAAIGFLSEKYGLAWEEALSELGEVTWHSPANTRSDSITITMNGCGWVGGSAEQSAEWARRVAEVLVKPMLEDQILDLMAEMESKLAADDAAGDGA